MRKLLTTTAAVLLGLGLAVASAVPANAHNSAADVTCTTASVSLTNYDSGATAQITLDGDVLHTGTFNGHLVQSWPATGNVEHTFTVVVDSADNKYDLNYSETTQGCYIPPVETAVTVSVVHEVCAGDVGTITLTGEHVTWTIVNDFVSGDNYPAGTPLTGIPSGTYAALMMGDAPESVGNPRVYGHSVFTAVADAGYTITGESVFEVDSAPAVCEVIPSPPTLAATGAESFIPLGIAGGLLLIGGLLFSLDHRLRVVRRLGE